MNKIIIVSIILLIGSISQIKGQQSITLYVNNTSSNNTVGCGLTQDNGCQNLAIALSTFTTLYNSSSSLTLILAAGTYTGASNQNLNFNNYTLTITSTQSTGTIIDLGGNSNLVNVTDQPNSLASDKTNFVLSNITVQNGGNIVINYVLSVSTGYITLQQSTFLNNTASIGSVVYYKSAIINSDNITISNCVFINNTATDKNSASIIYITNCDIVVSNSNFSSMSVRYIIFQQFGIMSISNSNFNNIVYNGANGAGAVIYIFNSITKSIIQQSTFTNNAIYGSVLLSLNSAYAVSNSTFTNNNSTAILVSSMGNIFPIVSIIDTVTITNSKGIKYGAIYLSNGAMANIKNSVIDGCAAVYGGAASIVFGSTAVFKNVTFRNNVGVSYGGAIYAYSSDVTVSASTFLGNIAQSGPIVYNNGSVLDFEDSTIGNSQSAITPGLIECVGVDGSVEISGITLTSNKTTELVSCGSGNCVVTGDDASDLCSNNNNSNKDGLTTGQKIGIAFGVIIGIAIIGVLIFIVYKRNQNSNKYGNYNYNTIKK